MRGPDLARYSFHQFLYLFPPILWLLAVVLKLRSSRGRPSNVNRLAISFHFNPKTLSSLRAMRKATKSWVYFSFAILLQNIEKGAILQSTKPLGAFNITLGRNNPEEVSRRQSAVFRNCLLHTTNCSLPSTCPITD